MHGWGGNKKSFKCVQNFCSGEHKLVFLDLPGFGNEKPPPYAYGAKEYALWLAQKLRQMNIKEKVCFVGHSFGGRVAICYASIFPEKVDRVCLVDSAGIKPKFKIKRTIKLIWFRFYKKCANIGLCSKEKLKKFGSSDYKALSPEMKSTFVKLVNEDLSLQASQVHAKTLIVWGEKDKDTPLYMAKRLNKLIKNSELIVFEKCGHFAYLERLPQFCMLIDNFFD